MTSLERFIRDSLQRIGADGMVDIGTECSCCLENLMPCGDGPYSDCQPGKKLIVPADGEDLINPLTGEIVHHNGKPGNWVMVPFDGTGGSGRSRS